MNLKIYQQVEDFLIVDEYDLDLETAVSMMRSNDDIPVAWAIYEDDHCLDKSDNFEMFDEIYNGEDITCKSCGGMGFIEDVVADPYSSWGGRHVSHECDDCDGRGYNKPKG